MPRQSIFDMKFNKVYPLSETIRFKKLEKNNKDDIAAMSRMASSIVKEHFDPLVGPEQNDYMIRMFQTEEAIAGQMDTGYEYYFVLADTEVVGFLAFYDDAPELHLSKFYLYKEMRGKGYAKEMQKFVIQAAKDKGLKAIALNVNRNNSSVQIYKALGYYIAREEVNAIGHGYVMDDFVMRYEWH